MVEFIIGMVETEDSIIKKVKLFDVNGSYINCNPAHDYERYCIDGKSVKGFRDFSSANKFINTMIETYDELVASQVYKNETILITYPDIILCGFDYENGVRIPRGISRFDNKNSQKKNSVGLKVIRKEGDYAYMDQYTYTPEEINKLKYKAKILKYGHSELLYILDKINDELILKSLTFAIKHNVDITKIQNIESFDISQIYTLISAINRGTNIELICDPKFESPVMKILLEEIDKNNDVTEFINLPDYISSRCIKCSFILKKIGCEYKDLLNSTEWTYKSEEIYCKRVFAKVQKLYLEDTGKELNVSFDKFKRSIYYITRALMRHDGSWLYIISQVVIGNSNALRIERYFKEYANNKFISLLHQYTIDTPNNLVITWMDDIIKYDIDPKKTGLDTITNHNAFSIRLHEIIKVIKKFG